jgi:cysteinyl-tRNA synthetase
MSSKYLWDQFDIHTWWVDHIWVHHTNEIAQSECTFWKKPWVKYWMHNQFLNLWWKKLSKSAGWLVTVDDLEEKWYSALDLKLLYYTAHYRNFLDFNENVLEQAKVQRKNLIKKINNSEKLELKWSNYKEIAKELKTDDWIQFLSDCLDALLDDLNTPKLFALINSWLKKQNPEIIWIILRFDKQVMKLDLLWEKESSKAEEIPQEIVELANKRLQAKQNKDYELADQLRNEIQQMWFSIKDTPWWFEIEKI